MGDYPSRSVNATAGDLGVTPRHAQGAGYGNSPSNYNEPPLGGGGALPKKTRFSIETGFRGLSTAAGAMVLVIIVAIAVFLISKAVPALQANNASFLTELKWFPNDTQPVFGIAALAFGTVLSSIIALIVAVPIALSIALFLSHYAPRRLATPLGFVIDLLAAVPSVVFGLWGRDVFQQPVRDFSIWLNEYFGWIPLFGGEGPFGQSIMLGGLVLAIMVLPIVTSLSREVFQQTPGMNEEAALALGATRWEMIRTAVLPYGKPGVIAAVMLGLGRALGETIALALTLSIAFKINFNLIENGGNSIAANIANAFGEANETGRGALIASGLVLFVITLVVNMTARAIIYRRREFRDSAA
ncbi:phosphate transport system permease protein [Actinoplanes lobatus]|uniref:Phosphate transport system permease protein n=1 Tax=Actinoplanes lobatus TaxID=113568 RepID=A0A7W7HBA1_9ACTN|nr:phosphate ABC transporter permease subunit PstC [Actinoplanes lobatus]MBB4747411.1 phosphate transport system permease protein [Actinoplanes lobatus]GGN78964.1 phosphate transport system permease protein [Actinoplanes lobatus]GIE42619.1 phosphate transport system permease protein [Actinoplanes lobatus]